MARNIEIKARVSDLAEIRARVLALGCRGEEHLRQSDTFFQVARGRLKLREFGDGSGELIFYERPDDAGAKLSRYERLPCAEPERMRRVLTTALGVKGSVKKQRHVLLVGNTRVHLDEVEGLGSFVELEVVLGDSEPAAAGEKVAAELMRALGIEASSLVSGAYLDLL
jgi:predicted adenylyl cyclase CyaB